jgi:formamidopyrimidine-DNA glycosylase
VLTRYITPGPKMPELPEVESLRQILARSACKRTIVDVQVRETRLRRVIEHDIAERLVGGEIEAICRRAKYLLIALSGERVILVHLGMSGSLTHRRTASDDAPFIKRHDHLQIILDDSSRLVYNDPRRFGMMKVVARQELEQTPELSVLGPEPLSDDFNATYLRTVCRGRTAAVKNILMDQRVVAGIGNIYAAEILFRAGVRPTRSARRLKRDEIEAIVRFTPVILQAAIASRGTTFRSYRDSRGQPGRFQKHLMVYGREGEPCRVCGATVRNVVVGQRASCYCPRCQH